MVPELEIADLRRRLADHRALLRQLFELRWRLVNKAARGSAEHAERALRINEETITAVWRALRFAQFRLADLELILAGKQEDAECLPEIAPAVNGDLANRRFQPRHRPPLRSAHKQRSQRYRSRGTNDR